MTKFNTILVFLFTVTAFPVITEAGPLSRLLFPKETRFLIVFVDRSGSIPAEDWTIYRRTYARLVSTLRPGDRFVLGEISAKTLTSFTPVIDQEIPDKRSGHVKKVLTERAKEKLLKAFESLESDRQARDRKAHKTAIFDALNVAAMLFAADRSRKGRRLLLLSDMVEDSEDARFEEQTLSPTVANNIIAKRKGHGSLPNLQGVRIFVAGGRAETSRKFFEVRRFWESYFKEAGATIAPGDYVRDGLHFEDKG